MSDKWRITVASPPDREMHVVEIFFGDLQWAEINQEHSALEVEFYSRPDGRPWRFPLQDAIVVLREAKSKLTK